ncbi:hypothetical protein M5E87_02005 [Flavonifractor plautii]|nr:hypothetical protein M5E87_02005 [Flavonifractor plautii]
MEGGREKVKLFLIAGLIAVVAVVAVVLAMQMNQPYTTLFTGLNQTELNEIVSYLSEQGMADYRIEGSDTILVLKRSRRYGSRRRWPSRATPSPASPTPCIWIMWGA